MSIKIDVKRLSVSHTPQSKAGVCEGLLHYWSTQFVLAVQSLTSSFLQGMGIYKTQTQVTSSKSWICARRVSTEKLVICLKGSWRVIWVQASTKGTTAVRRRGKEKRCYLIKAWCLFSSFQPIISKWFMRVRNMQCKIYKPFYVQLNIAQGATHNREDILVAGLHSSVSMSWISKCMNLGTCTYSKSVALDASRYCRL